jgi:hypothetical protein
MVNVLSLTNGRFRNFVGTLTTSTTGVELVATTTTAQVIKVSGVLLANASTALLSTASLTLVSGGVTHTLASGVDVDPSQVPVRVVSKETPVYLTGTQSIRAFASGSNVSAVVSYEEFS